MRPKRCCAVPKKPNSNSCHQEKQYDDNGNGFFTTKIECHRGKFEAPLHYDVLENFAIFFLLPRPQLWMLFW